MNTTLTRSQFNILEAIDSLGHLQPNEYNLKDFHNLCEIGLITDGGGG